MGKHPQTNLRMKPVVPVRRMPPVAITPPLARATERGTHLVKAIAQRLLRVPSLVVGLLAKGILARHLHRIINPGVQLFKAEGTLARRIHHGQTCRPQSSTTTYFLCRPRASEMNTLVSTQNQTALIRIKALPSNRSKQLSTKKTSAALPVLESTEVPWPARILISRWTAQYTRTNWTVNRAPDPGNRLTRLTIVSSRTPCFRASILRDTLCLVIRILAWIG